MEQNMKYLEFINIRKKMNGKPYRPCGNTGSYFFFNGGNVKNDTEEATDEKPKETRSRKKKDEAESRAALEKQLELERAEKNRLRTIENNKKTIKSYKRRQLILIPILGGISLYIF